MIVLQEKPQFAKITVTFESAEEVNQLLHSLNALEYEGQLNPQSNSLRLHLLKIMTGNK